MPPPPQDLLLGPEVAAGLSRWTPPAHLTEKMFDSYDNGQGSVGFFIGPEGAYI